MNTLLPAAASLASLLSAAAFGQVEFEWSYVNNLPDRVSAVEWVDLDGDGRKDFLIGDREWSRGALNWARAEGGGAFSQFRPIDEFTNYVARVDAADMNGDGVTDVLALSPADDSVRWYRGLGGGAFGEGHPISPGAQEHGNFVPADVDGDGDTDIVAARFSPNQILWHENLGGGVFSGQNVLAAASGFVSGLVVADLDADGDIEIFFTERPLARVSVIEGQGGGTFAASAVIISGLSNANALATGDFNGDGSMDLAAAGSQSLAWFERVPGTSLTLVERDRIRGISGVADSLDVADVNLDGQDDILIEPGVGFAQVRGLATGGSTFGPALGFTEVQSPYESIFADVNDDGLMDVVSAGSRLPYAPGEPGGGFGAERSALTDLGGVPEVNPVDFDGDGDLDVLSAHSKAPLSSGLGRTIAVYERLSEGEFATPRELSPPGLLVYSPGAADLDGDGAPDLFFTIRDEMGSSSSVDSLVSMKGDGAGGFGPVTLIERFPTNEFVNRGVFTGDFDGDGDSDLVLHVGLDPFNTSGGRLVLLENLGPGTFAPSRTLFDDARLRLLSVHDDDGDGLPDLYVGTSMNTLEIHAADPALPSGFRLAAAAPGNLPGRAVFARTFDLGGDGDLDVVLTTTDEGQSVEEVILFERLGTGLGPELSMGIQTLSGPDLLGHDWDRDGDEDILACFRDGLEFFWFEQDGGALLPAAPLPGIEPSVSFLPFSNTRISDADGDGDVDFWIPEANSLRLYRNATELGAFVCPGEPNSVGAGASLSLTGTDFTSSNGLVLTARELPPTSTTLFLVSRETGMSQPAASQGTLCLGGAIGRYVASGQVQSADGNGQARLVLDLTMTPNPTLPGPGPAVAGERLFFQAWYRDANPQVTSNFTAASGLVLR